MNSLDTLKKIKKDKGLEIYFVGGYVRDLFRRKRARDIDLLVRGVSVEELIALLAPHGVVKEVGVHFGVILFRAYNDSKFVEIALPRRFRKYDRKNFVLDFDEYGSLKKDAAHRDFTVNAMFLPLGSARSRVIDFYGGRGDIKKRLIRAVGSPAQRIKEDPVRMIRAFSLAARLGYKIDEKFLVSVRKNARLIQTSIQERVRNELVDILLSKKPSKQLRLMEKFNLLQHILPFVSKNVGVRQDGRYHKFSVFEHLIRACDNTPPELTLRLAALMHDVGKYSVRHKTKERTSFHNHEVVSEIMARDMLTRLVFPKDVILEVTSLIRKHMYNYNREWTDRAVRKFIREVGIKRDDLDNLSEIPLFKLREADRLGNGFKRNARTEKQKDFEKRIKKVYKESTALTVHDLNIRGGKLINELNIEPGPIVGEILKHLLNLVLDKPQLNKEKTLLEEAAKYLNRVKG